jgi:hypothetical protein
MRTRFLGLAVLAIAGALATAPANADNSPITVHVRVEGKTKTLFDGKVTTRGHKVDGNDGTGPHKCNGTNAGANPKAGPTLLAAFDDARQKAGLTWNATWFKSFEDFSINRIGPDSSDTKNNRYWGQVLNYKDTQVGGCQQRIKPGDDVLIAFNSFGHPKLRLYGPKKAKVGHTVHFVVIDGQTDKPFKGARVHGHRTGKKGRVAVTFSKAGTHRLKAHRKGAVRSNRLTVKVSAED